MDWIGEIAKTLKPLNIPTQYGWYDENLNATHITFCEINDVSGSHSDDEETDHSTVVQVDIWSDSDNLELKNKIKKLIKTLDFACYKDGYSDIETDKQPHLYHDALRFNLFIEEE